MNLYFLRLRLPCRTSTDTILTVLAPSVKLQMQRHPRHPGATIGTSYHTFLPEQEAVHTTDASALQGFSWDGKGDPTDETPVSC